MRKVVSLLILFTHLIVSGQSKYWYTVVGGRGDEIAYGVKQLWDNNYVVVGSTTTYGAGMTDGYVGFFSTDGARLWEKTYGGTNADVIKKVCVFNQDSTIGFVGYSSSHGINNGYDIWAALIRKDGTLVWETFIGTSDWEFGTDIAATNDQNILITGYGFNSILGGSDGLAYKLNKSTGQIMWSRVLGGAMDDRINGIGTKDNKDFFLVGETKSFGEPNGDIFCVRINQLGDTLTKFTFGGTSEDYANSVLVLPNNDIVVGGSSSSFTNGKMDAFFAKFDSSGVFKWKNYWGLAGDDEECYKLTYAQTANLEESIAIYTTKESAVYLKDVKTIFINNGGNYFGGFDSGKFGFSQDDEAFDISTASDKGYIEVGYMTDTVYGDKNILIIKQDTLLREKKVVYTSIAEESENKGSIGICVLPNPVDAGRFMQIVGISPNLTTELYLHDVTGREAYSCKLQVGFSVFYPPADLLGVYSLTIVQNQNRKTLKVIFK